MVQKYVFFIGIDMSKDWFDASFTTDGNKARMIHRRFDNVDQGFAKLIEWLAKLIGKKRLPKKQIFFCMEHTGAYTLPLCHFLKKKKLAFLLVAGLEIKNSLGLRRGKNDKSDSKDIARYTYLRRDELKTSDLACEELMAVKNLLSYRTRLLKCKNGLDIAAGELKSFAPAAQRRLVFDDTKQLTNNIQKRIKKVEKEILAILKAHEELWRLYGLVTSVRGVGIILGSTFLVHTNGFKNFKNARKFASYCCVAPFEESSGSSIKKKAKVSPLGNRKVKALLSNAACNVVRTDKELKAYYERKMEEGKNKFLVLNAVKFKLIARVFAVVKRGTPFIEGDLYRA